MFSYNEETRFFWFSATDLDLSMEFDLIGVLMGLAIYNSHILDVHFPPVLYKKLLGKPVDLEDMAGVREDLNVPSHVYVYGLYLSLEKVKTRIDWSAVKVLKLGVQALDK